MARKQGATNTGYSVESRPRTSGKPHWRVRIWIDDPDNPGKKKPETVGTYPTKTAANEAGRDAVYNRDRGTYIDPKKVTFGELVDIWFVNKSTGKLTDNTKRDYEIAIDKHIRPSLGPVLLKSLSPTGLQAAYDKWQADGMSAWMVHRCHIVIRQALNYAVTKDLVFRNLADTVSLPRKPRETKTVWTPDEARLFLDKALHRPIAYRQSLKPNKAPVDHGTRPDPLSPLWHLLVLEGLRRGEALGLRWKDFNIDTGLIHIQQSVVADKSNGGSPVIQNRTKTRTGARTVRLTEDTVDVLKAHRKAQNEIRLASAEWEDNDLIVCTAQGKPINPSNVSAAFKRLVALAGVPEIRVHDLRHTSATLLLRAGVPTKIVSERLGHASVGITSDLYSHVTPDMQESASVAMSNILKKSTLA